MSDRFKDQTILITIGMHRSGTSLISRSMRVFGGTHGMNLWTMDDNPKGHWEDRDVIKLNNMLLEHVNRTWRSVTEIEPTEIEGLLQSNLSSKAKAMLLEKLEGKTIFSFKDPRTSLLLPFWHSIFLELGLKPVYIFAIRNPIAVAQSLAARDGFSINKGLLIWINYNNTIANGLTRMHASYSIIEYNQMLDNCEQELRRVAAEHDLTIDTNELMIFKTTFIDPSLDHCQSGISSHESNLLNIAHAIFTFLKNSSKTGIRPNSANNHLSDAIKMQLLAMQEALAIIDETELDYNRLLKEADKGRHAQDTLQIVYETFSWKVTKPLRTIMCTYKKLKGHRHASNKNL